VRKIKLKIKKLISVKTPSYATPNDAGLDLYSPDNETIKQGERLLIPMGIKIAVPIGYEAQIRPKSGLALKHGISILNTPGTIDSGYRGEIGIILVNFGESDFIIEKGMKIAQMIINKIEQVEIEEVDELDTTERNEGGFGSTGEK